MNHRTRFKSKRRKENVWFYIVVAIVVVTSPVIFAAASSPSSSSGPTTQSTTKNGMILRVRLKDGSMERIQIKPGSEDTLSLKEALAPLLERSEHSSSSSSSSPTIQVQTGSNIQSNVAPSLSKPLSSFGLKNGSLITITEKSNSKESKGKQKSSSFSKSNSRTKRWDPFPELAKNYEMALRKTKTLRSSQKGMSFSDIATLQSSLHIIEPQKEGPVKRAYICRHSAERFQNNCYNKKTNSFTSRCGLLLGTIQRERVHDSSKKRARTSLSSTTEDTEYCTTIKVHALWEPPQQEKHSKGNAYHAKALEEYKDEDNDNNENDSNTGTWLPSNRRVLEIADLLGLKPVGWIFAYTDDRQNQKNNKGSKKSADEDILPAYGHDIQVGSKLQINNMKSYGRIEGSRFVLFAMDAKIGATEAFQLSDVTIQMVSENLWVLPDIHDSTSNQRIVNTKHNVLIDSSEKNQLDSVLCLINTAMLSHEGSYTHPTMNPVKKNGIHWTLKAKRNILSAITNKDDSQLLENLCDFNLLLALDRAIPNKKDMEQICSLVRKYARGQKRSTTIDNRLKLLLQNIFQH